MIMQSDVYSLIHTAPSMEHFSYLPDPIGSSHQICLYRPPVGTLYPYSHIKSYSAGGSKVHPSHLESHRTAPHRSRLSGCVWVCAELSTPSMSRLTAQEPRIPVIMAESDTPKARPQPSWCAAHVLDWTKDTPPRRVEIFPGSSALSLSVLRMRPLKLLKPQSEIRILDIAYGRCATAGL
ncbi:uncharacterized protein LY79DRAFT_248226 [Colletotrichum navitas]|uniref:Uncharacterized protein n=1 Tax=Colletotrichum navitas TaxID=681940 RepID=A0AAD8QAE2_9PEZI|nr:uncharacterized protein LY79DRAFT_248226 [Colletotrichum navitas]KAK1598569.1 hypothetical protein LY79DRAFT_248226 [Colletotrichum navitas]